MHTSPTNNSVRLAIDVGGTFTDAITLTGDGVLTTEKSLTTADDVAHGCAAVVDRALAGTRAETIVHGTTLTLNAVLTKRYPRTALITTAGFRDVLEIMRGDRRDLFDIYQEKPRPLIPRSLRFEVEERISADGTILTALAEDDVKRVLDELKAASVDAVAVCLLFSFVNPDHELQLGQALADHLPELAVSLSHDVLPVHREFERTSTTVINALGKPLMGRYLERISKSLERNGSGSSLYVMQSSGGVMGWQEAMERPVYTMYSGPSGGVVCAAELGRLVGFENVISFDMGGTSSDVSAVTGDDPDRVTYFEVARYPVQIPALDIVSVGAGGGSIAWDAPGGSLQVGPDSAGATPGPACYARGGERPTVTDAAVCLGWYNPESALGGQLPIDAALAHRAIAKLGRALDLDVHEVAWGVLRVLNVNMAHAVREVSVERGRDPRDYVLAAMGGAGGAHAFEVAEELGIGSILIGPFPGAASAQGMLLAEFRRDAAYAVHRLTSDIDVDDLERSLRAMGEELTEHARGIQPTDLRLFATADLRYRGQTFDLPVAVTPGRVDLGALTAGFEALHARRYGHSIPGAEIEIVNLRVSVTGRFRSAAWRRARWSRPESTARSVYWGPEQGWRETPVVGRDAVEAMDEAVGPMIIEQADATIVIAPGWRGRAVVPGCLLLRNEKNT